MNGKRVYDLPTRVFHWIFAGCFLTAFAIANTVDDDGTGFSYHMIAGMVMVFAVILRIVWGVIGSPHARFKDFSLRPAALVNYLKSALIGMTRFWSGHNPASSWAAVIMMLLALGLGITGYLMISSPAGESLEDVHEVLANSFIVVVLLHVAGIMLHTVKHKDPIGKSMINGRKQHVPDTEIPVTSHTAVGLLVLALSLGGGVYLVGNYNPDSRTLSIAGNTLQLTELEDGDHGRGHDDDREEDDD
ncbi:MAG: cytochrome b/b6 domain-containing protein [Xanthomonadales bacterium]|nr:cytochrome b/b6 domain-containing protein [Xanthomonadales bacterium]